jgi:uridine kinase
MNDLKKLLAAILAKRKATPAQHSILIGITGIEGAGKSYITEKLVAKLEPNDLRVAVINIDDWMNLPHKRFNKENPAEHFYENAIRFKEIFKQLIVPLKETRSVHLEADITRGAATRYHKHIYHFEDVDCIILEGSYLFKRAFYHYFDLKVWINCTFETALKRILQRAPEGLSSEEIIHAYQTIYFPAQRMHFAKDKPYSIADMIISNDSRIIG